MNKKKTIKIKRSLVVKDCEKDFGIGEGVLVQDMIAYEVEGDYNPQALAQKIFRDSQDFLNENVEVRLEEIHEPLIQTV